MGLAVEGWSLVDCTEEGTSTRALAELGRDIISALEVTLLPRECRRLVAPPIVGMSLLSV